MSNTRPSIPFKRASSANTSSALAPRASFSIRPFCVSEANAAPARSMAMSLQTEAGAGRGYAPLSFPDFRSNATREEVPDGRGAAKRTGRRADPERPGALVRQHAEHREQAVLLIRPDPGLCARASGCGAIDDPFDAAAEKRPIGRGADALRIDVRVVDRDIGEWRLCCVRDTAGNGRNGGQGHTKARAIESL